MATGHQLGDTGDFSNNIYVGFPVQGAGGSGDAPSRERRACWARSTSSSAGTTSTSRPSSRSRATPASRPRRRQARAGADLRPHRAQRPEDRHRIDDSTGRAGGIPLSDEITKRLAAAQLPLQAPTRGDNGKPATHHPPVANVGQQAYLTDVADQGAAAAVQGTQQAVRPGLLVARSGRHAARPGRQPRPAGAGHQRADLAGRHQERRRQSRPAAGRAEGAGPRGDDRRDPHLRPRLLDHLQGKRHKLGRAADLQGRADQPATAGLRGHRPGARRSA